jgi:hypothetical protein
MSALRLFFRNNRRVDTAIAIYGAVLATVIAIGQGVSSWRKRVRVGVSTTIGFIPIDEDDRDSARGTPVQVTHGRDVLWEEALLRLTVRNQGGVPVQIVAIVIESLRPDGGLSAYHIAAEPLPFVLDPGTRVEVSVQKEPLDTLDNVTFLGVIDGLGRRYSPNVDEVRRVVRQSWDLPTRVQVFQRKDDPTAPPILAYQNRQTGVYLDTTGSSTPKTTPLIRRPPLLEQDGGVPAASD